MSKIESINDIDEIVVHWSENTHINEVLGRDENCDIEKEVSVEQLDELIKQAASEIKAGYDKTSMSVKLKSGLQWCSESKFHITKSTVDLMSLLNSGQ